MIDLIENIAKVSDNLPNLGVNILDTFVRHLGTAHCVSPLRRGMGDKDVSCHIVIVEKEFES